MKYEFLWVDMEPPSARFASLAAANAGKTAWLAARQATTPISPYKPDRNGFKKTVIIPSRSKYTPIQNDFIQPEIMIR